MSGSPCRSGWLSAADRSCEMRRTLCTWGIWLSRSCWRGAQSCRLCIRKCKHPPPWQPGLFHDKRWRGRWPSTRPRWCPGARPRRWELGKLRCQRNVGRARGRFRGDGGNGSRRQTCALPRWPRGVPLGKCPCRSSWPEWGRWSGRWGTGRSGERRPALTDLWSGWSPCEESLQVQWWFCPGTSHCHLLSRLGKEKVKKSFDNEILPSECLSLNARRT